MKSIIEQASSTMKAIEKAWSRAEYPKQFSIKVLEQEEKNFFGMTTKPAKVCIFFADASQKAAVEKIEKKVSEKQTTQEQCTAMSHMQIKQLSKQSSVGEKVTHKLRGEKGGNAADSQEKNLTIKHQKTHLVTQKASAEWNNAMVHAALEWIKNVLTYMSLPSVQFSTEIMGKNLKITFSKPLAPSTEQNKQLFRSFSYLIIASLRNQFKQDVKSLKVILTNTE